MPVLKEGYDINYDIRFEYSPFSIRNLNAFTKMDAFKPVFRVCRYYWAAYFLYWILDWVSVKSRWPRYKVHEKKLWRVCVKFDGKKSHEAIFVWPKQRPQVFPLVAQDLLIYLWSFGSVKPETQVNTARRPSFRYEQYATESTHIPLPTNYFSLVKVGRFCLGNFIQ